MYHGEIIVYTKPVGICQQCKMVKRYLDNQDIYFSEVKGDEQVENRNGVTVAELLKEKGFMTYPVTYLKGLDKYIVGFNVKELDHYLKQ